MRNFEKGLFTRLIDGVKAITYKPVNMSQKQEAADKGLMLLFRSTDPNYNYYEFESCGHHDFLQPTHVRRGNFKCSTCFNNRLTTEAHLNGFMFLHHASSNNKKYIKPCGHIVELAPQSVVNNKKIKCQDCFEERLSEVGERNGYKYSNEVYPKGFRKIKFIGCGHEKIVLQSQIQKGNVVCRDCIDLAQTEEAMSHGVVLISNIGDRYNLYALPCGHEKVLRIDHACDGSYLCTVCEDSHYSKPSNLYLFKFTVNDFSWLKFGYAKNLNNRASNYGLPVGVIKETILEIPMPTGYSAMKVEKEIHREVKQHRLNKIQMKEYHKFNGFTECYSYSSLGVLISKIGEKMSND